MNSLMCKYNNSQFPILQSILKEYQSAKLRYQNLVKATAFRGVIYKVMNRFLPWLLIRVRYREIEVSVVID